MRKLHSTPAHSAPATRRAIRRILTGSIAAVAALASQSAKAQSVHTWNGGIDLDWGNAANWTGGVPDGSDEVNILGAGGGILTNVYSGFTSQYRLFFNAGAGAYTLNGPSTVTFFDFSGNAPKIENNSVNTQTINFGVAMDGTGSGGAAEINPVDGNLVFGSTVDLAGTTQLRIFGNNGKSVTFTGALSSSGNGGANSVSINQNSTVIFAGANTYTGDTFINAGKLQFAQGSSSASAFLRLGDTAGAAAAELSITDADGGTIVLGGLNVRSGSSGAKTITATNTSGTNTFSGSVFLDADVATSTATGGTLAFTGSAFDLKNQTLTVGGTGTTTIGGVVQNSSGTGKITKTGAGTLILTGANTHTGATTVSVGTLQATVNTTQNSLGTGAASVAGGATIQLNNTNTTATAVTIGNTFTGAGLLKLNFAAAGLARNTVMNNVTGVTGTIQLSNAGANADKWSVAALGTLPAALIVDNNSQLFVGAGTTAFSGGINVQGTGNSEIRGAIRLAGTLGGVITLANSATIGTEGGTLSGNITSGAAGTQTLTFGSTNSVGNATASGIIGGGTGTITLTKTAAGTLTLTGANSYTGLTTVSAGTLQVGNILALGTTAAGTTVASGAVLDLNGIVVGAEALTLNGTGISSGGALINSSATASSLSGTIDLATNSSLGGAGAGLVTLSGVISGAGTLTKVGAGTTLLSGVNTYATATTVSAGTLRAGNAAAFGTTAGGVSITAGAVVDLNGQAIGAEAFTLNGTGISSGGALINSSATAASLSGTINLATASSLGGNGTGLMTLSGIVSGAGTLTKVGTGTTLLSGANTYATATTVSAGTLRLGNILALGTTVAGTTVSATGAVLDLNGIVVGAEALTLNGTGIASGGALVNSSGTASSLSGTVALASASSVGGAGNITLSGVMSGAFGLTKVGAGTLTLTGVNTFTGNVSISGGTLVTAMTNAITGNLGSVATPATLSKTVFLTNGGAFRTTTSFNDNTGAAAVLQIVFNIGTGGGTLDTPTGITLTLDDNTAAGAAQNAAQLQGAGDLTKTGTGILSLGNGASNFGTFTGQIFVNAGTLTTGAVSTNPFGTTAAGTTVASGATVNVNGVSIGAEPLTLNGIGTGAAIGALTSSTGTGGTSTGTINLATASSLGGAGTLTLGGVISGAGTLTKVGAGTTVLNGANTYATATTVSAGTLQLGNVTALGTTAAGTTVASGAVLDLNGIAVGAEALTLNGTGISSGGALINSSANAASLSGDVSFASASSIGGTGAITLSGILSGAGDVTKVNTGTLLINGGSNTQSGTFTVTGGSLGGSGNLASSTVTLATGTILSPGNTSVSAGTLTIANTLVSSGTNSAIFNLGTSSDLVNVGTLTQDGTTNIAVVSGPGIAPGTYTLFDYATLNGTNGFAGFALGANHVDGSLVNNVGAGSIDLTLNSLNPLVWTGESNGIWVSGSIPTPCLPNFSWLPDPNNSVEFVNLDNVLFDDNNTGTTSIIVNTNITPSAITFNNSSLNYTLDTLAPGFAAGNISGTTGIVKNGTGTTTLLGAPSFTGAIAVNAGTLQLGGDSRVAQFKGGTAGDAFGSGPAISVAAGATLAIASGNNVTNIYSNNISGAGSILLNASQQDPFFNYMADRGDVRFNGDLSGFTGTITINDGNRLQVTAASNLGAASGMVIQNGGGLYTAGTITSAVPLSIAGKGWTETAGMLGALRLGSGATLSGAITMTGDSRITAFGSTGTLSGPIGGAFNLELGFNHSNLAAAGSSGTLTLSNPASTYSGDTSITRMTINADNIAIAGANSSLGSGDDIVMNASTLNVTGAGPMTTNRTFTLGAMGIGASTIGVTDPANTLTITGALNNVQPVAASGQAFRQGLNFLQTTTAGTGGTVILNTATPIVTSGTTVHRQNLTLAGSTNFTVGASGFGAAGAFNLGNSVTADQGGATVNIQDSAVLTVFGEFDIGNQGVAQTYVFNQSGTSIVNALRGGGVGSDAAGATNINNRAMRLGHWPAENTTYNLTGGTLNVPNGHLWVGWDGQATFNQSAGTTVNAAGLRMVNGSTLAVAYNLNGGTLNIGAYGFAKGGGGASVPQFNFNGGTYRATADHLISGNIAINMLAGGGTFDTNGFNVTSASAILVGAGGAFTKAGLGELTLPTGNSVSGGIIINGGSLSSAAGAAITASTVTVNSGGTLGGGFTITSAGGTVVSSGGIVSPGASNGALGGTLTTSLLTLSAGSQINLAPTSDVITVTTASTGLSGSTNINVLPVGTLAASPINLINYTTANTLVFTSSLPHLIAASVTDNGLGQIQLLHGGQETLTWTGGTDANWDTVITSVNFNASTSGAVSYLQGDVSIFDDSTAPAFPAITVAAGGVTPASVVINDVAGVFSFSGGGINGGTSLTKNGAGITILANNNRYTGTTTIAAGTLQIGNGGTAGTLGLGDVTNNGTLSFNRTDASAYLGVISGTGILRHDGTGTTTLGILTPVNANTVANPYTGDTIISKGTLEGNHNSFGTGTITLNDAATGANNTALLIRSGGAATIANNIVVSNNGTGNATIGSSEDSLVASGLQFTGTLTLDRPTRLLGETDRTTFTGIISGNVGTLTIGRSAGLEDFEQGRVVIEKDNTFVGNVVVEAFTNLQLTDISNLPALTAKNQIPDTASVTLGDTSFLSLGNTGTVADTETIGDLISSFSTSQVRNVSTAIASPNNVTLTYGTANDATFNGIVNGGNTFDLIKQGAGIQTFGGTLDNGGARMIVNAGTVVLAKDSSNVVHAIGGPLVINTGGTVQLGGTYTAFRDQDTNRDNPTQYQVNAPANFGDQIFNNVDVTLNTGGFFDLNGKSEVINGLIGTGGIVTNDGAVASTLYLGSNNSAGTFPGVIQNGTSAVNIAKGGSGTMVFGGTNTYTGTTSINSGTLTITNIAGLGHATGGTFINSNRENSGSASQLTISVATASDPTTPNILAEPITLTSELSNDLRTNIGNTVESTRLTGLITIQGDGLNQIFANQAAGDQFQINGGISGTATGILFLRGNGEMALNSVVNAPNVILSKTDPGLLILMLNATGHDYRETNLVHGTVRADVVNALDTGAILRMGQSGNGNTLDLNGNNQQIAGLLSNPGITAFARTITSTAAATLNINTPAANGGDYLFAGNITGAITLEKSGPGAQALMTPASGVNSYTGNTIVNEGILRLCAPNLIPDGAGFGNVIVGTGAGFATLDVNANAETINGLHGNANGIVTSNGTGNPVLTVNGTATPATTATFGGVIMNRTDGGTSILNLTKADVGTQILTGANTYTGTTTITAGTLQIGNGGTTGSLATASTIVNNGNLTINRSNAVAQGTDFSGAAITGTGSFTQAGSGTTTLTATNTFTGATTISAGTLEAAGAASLGTTSGVAVTTGGTLLLSGTGNQVNDAAAVTLGNLATIRSTIDGLDETMGVLTLSGNSTIDFGTFAAGNIFRFADSSAATWGAFTLAIHNWTPIIDKLYFGINNSSLLPSQLSKISFYSDAGSTLFNGSPGGLFNGTPFDGINGEVSPVPEPSSIATVMGLLGLVGWRERRKAQQARAAERRAIG